MATEIEQLLQARRDAIARGDKALGREIYHRLETQYGLQGHQIDATNDGSALPESEAGASVEREVTHEPETTQADPAPETATPPKAKRTRKQQG